MLLARHFPKKVMKSLAKCMHHNVPEAVLKGAIGQTGRSTSGIPTWKDRGVLCWVPPFLFRVTRAAGLSVNGCWASHQTLSRFWTCWDAAPALLQGILSLARL